MLLRLYLKEKYGKGPGDYYVGQKVEDGMLSRLCMKDKYGKVPGACNPGQKVEMECCHVCA